MSNIKENQTLKLEDGQYILTNADGKSSVKWTQTELHNASSGAFMDLTNFHLDVDVTNLTTSLVNISLPSGVERTKSLNSIFIPFQFIESIAPKERAPTYNSKTFLSRFEPIQLWQGGSPWSVDLVLIYVALDMLTYNEEWVEGMAALYKALSMPEYYNNESFFPPPKVYLKMGDLFDNIPCIVTAFSRELPMREFTNNEDKFNKNIFDNKETNRNNFLPKWQKFTVSLTSSYNRSLDAYGGTPSFSTMIRRKEGVTRGPIK